MMSVNRDTFTTYSAALQAAALTATRLAATSLTQDLAFHRSIDPILARDIDAFSDRVLSLASKVVRLASGKASRMQEEDDIVDGFVRNVVDPMEGMLESTDGALDVFLGKRKDPTISVPAISANTWQGSLKKQPFRGRLDPALTHASHIPKPQLSFKHIASNTDESPYIPATLIPHKWCAKVPLGYVFHDERPTQGIEDVAEDDCEEERRKRMLHPYYYELTHPSYPDRIFNPPVEPSIPPSLDTPSPGVSKACHSLTFVSTSKALLSMAETIASATELAVDLEHHSYRSYKGFLALMQISTRQRDFVVDLLVPEIREGIRQAKDKGTVESDEAHIANEAGQIIARVFADPSVIKVFHGADSDMVWLQQDFNIFVVGLFDTFHASKLLEFPKYSLAYLLETYCDFMPDKRYQLADWRIRPLPTEMLTYARSDTHFLLYIYDMLRLSLIDRSSVAPTGSQQKNDRGLIHGTLIRSARTALRLYETDVYDAEGGTGSTGWETLARKWNKFALVGPPSQMRGIEFETTTGAAVYKAVHRWREEMAREEDESTRYILPTHHLFLLAEHVPATIPDLLSLLGGPGGVNGYIPPVVKRRLGELVAVIKDAVETIKPLSCPQGLTETGSESTGMVTFTVVKESESASLTPLASIQPNESRLWTATSSSMPAANISTSCSSLFSVGASWEYVRKTRTALPSFCGKGTYFAPGSALFGSVSCEATATSPRSTAGPASPHAQVSDSSAKHFEDVVQKIHNTLAITPIASMPSFSPGVLTQASESSHTVHMDSGMEQNSSAVSEALSDPTPPGPEGQIEIAFVPAHKRETLSETQGRRPTDDTIVVVGHVGTRQRKRKRDKARNLTLLQSKSITRPGGAEANASAGYHDQEMEVFDYSTVPNLLDDESMHGDARGVHEEGERKQKKQRHGKGSGLFEYGDFRAPPRDQREVRSGNKTHTFR